MTAALLSALISFTPSGEDWPADNMRGLPSMTICALPPNSAETLMSVA
jgi:hypothetical protein